MKAKSATPDEFHSRQRPADEAAVGARQRLRLCVECFLVSARGGFTALAWSFSPRGAVPMWSSFFSSPLMLMQLERRAA